jgi:hypothetical protein
MENYTEWTSRGLWVRLDSALELAEELRDAKENGETQPDLDGRLNRSNDRVARIVSILWDRDELKGLTND